VTAPAKEETNVLPPFVQPQRESRDTERSVDPRAQLSGALSSTGRVW
jgi:hypothetical protein